MRKLARAAIVIVLLGLGSVPLLHGGRPATAKSSKVLFPRVAVRIDSWIPRIGKSEPALLLVLGTGLIVSAGIFPGILRRRVRVKHMHVRNQEVENSLPEKVQRQSNVLLKVEPSARTQVQ